MLLTTRRGMKARITLLSRTELPTGRPQRAFSGPPPRNAWTQRSNRTRVFVGLCILSPPELSEVGLRSTHVPAYTSRHPLFVHDNGPLSASAATVPTSYSFKRSLQPLVASKRAPRSQTRENPPARVRFKRSPNQHRLAPPNPTHSRTGDAPIRTTRRRWFKMSGAV